MIMKKVYRNLLLVTSVFLLLLISFAGFSQTKTVSGTITDVQGSPMPGVNVVIKGTTRGTTSDATGKYSIEAEDEVTLQYSFIGYTTQEIRVGAQSRIDIKLEEDVATLQEVVVVGYGVQKKSDLTGAIASVDGEAMRGTMTSSVDQALMGRVAGVQVTQNSGQPGGAVSIRVRGTTSLTQSSEPLYVIDGIQISGNGQGISGFDWQGGSGGQQGAALNPMASINPNDIESIEVLKDASATAIYGSRAANGVVIITTKRGKKGTSTLSYNGFYGIQEVYKTLDMMDLPAYAEYNNEVAEEVSSITANERFADPSLLGEGTDWQAAVFQPAPMQSHTLTLSGGNDATRYMMSAGYFDQDGVIIGSDFQRFNTRVNLETRVRKGIDIGTNISISKRDETITLQDGGDGVISQAAQMPPHIPVKDFDGNYAGPGQQEGSAQIGSNPVALALLRNNTVRNNRIMTNLYADFEIIQGLKFRSEVSVDYSNTHNKAFQPSYKWGRIENPISRLAERVDESMYWLWKNYATYSKTFGGHDITFMAGIEAQKGTWESLTAYKINVPNDIPYMNQGDPSPIANGGDRAWNSLYSYFARANYVYNDRFLVTATIRRDASSRFGPQKRWGWFPSASIGWKISQESFLAESDVVSNLKLRASWGTTGNQEIGNYVFGSSLVTERSAFGNAVRNARYSNPLVQWESTTQYNIGLDLGLLQDRISFTLDTYLKKTDNLLLQVNLPGTFGSIVAGPTANVGDMENRGVEAAVNAVTMDKGKFKWTTNLNVTVNRNKVTTLPGSPLRNNIYWYTGFQNANITTVGYPVGQFYGYVMEGIFTSKQEILDHAVQIPDAAYVPVDEKDPGQNLIDRTTGVWLGDVKWKDINGDGKINSDDQTIIGDPNPNWTFGFNNTFSYGPFSLDVYLIGSMGGDILNFTRARNEAMTTIYDNQAMSVVNRARTQLAPGGTDLDNIDHVELVNPNTDIPRFDNGQENFNHHMSTRWLEDASYVRIQNLKLAYNLPSSLTSKVKITRMQVYTNIQNVATFTNYTGLDPQIGAFNQRATYQNIDMGRYPTPRVYSFGVNVDF
jgi:TonB-dependent starch-binding outer membrane protein SusC